MLLSKWISSFVVFFANKCVQADGRCDQTIWCFASSLIRTLISLRAGRLVHTMVLAKPHYPVLDDFRLMIPFSCPTLVFWISFSFVICLVDSTTQISQDSQVFPPLRHPATSEQAALCVDAVEEELQSHPWILQVIDFIWAELSLLCMCTNTNVTT